MPQQGIKLSPRSHLMTYEEIFEIASLFVKHGVTKIRLTGGEPFIRKDIDVILHKLSTLGVELSVTTNALLIDRFIPLLKECGIRNINVSLDSLDPDRFNHITRRNEFKKAYKNIFLLVKEGFQVKLNAVLIKGFNEDEIIDFIKLTMHNPIAVRFIEFMPFDGNKWDLSKIVSYAAIMESVREEFSAKTIEKLKDSPNDTAKNYKIKGYRGSFAVISSVTNPFCDTCNRLRLTANGQLKNCLFSAKESDILTSLRNGDTIEPIIQKAVQKKFKIRGGMNNIDMLKEPQRHSQNRSMITIGG